MEGKLLELFKVADELNEKQDKVFVEITYTANDNKVLDIVIRRKIKFTYVEQCKVMLINKPIDKINSIIKLLRSYIGG